MNVNKITLPLIASGLIISRCIYTDNIMVYNRVSNSIVSVKSINYALDPFNPKKIINKVSSIGTGFVYKDYIITNAHVINSSDEINILDKKVDIINVDIKHDIAILKNNNPKELKSLRKCNNSPEIGDEVIAIGNPFNLENTMTSGIVSGINRNINSEQPLFNLIQTDAAINPGNSGGPLISVKGSCVLGVNTVILSPSGGNIGIGFSIPISLVDNIINDNLISHTKLGIILIPDTIAETLDISGAIISDIIPGSIAENLGLLSTQRINDIPVIGDIIIGINDEEVKNSFDMIRILDQSDKITSIKIKNLEGIFEYKIK
jgi:S1-C subfamily serine protease